MKSKRHWFLTFGLTAVLILMITASVAETVSYFYVMMIGVVAGSVALFTFMFPTSYFFALALANFLGVYACLFTFIKLTSFPTLPSWVTHVGFALPVVAFLGGAVWRRNEIRAIVAATELTGNSRLGQVFSWLTPIAFISVLTFFVPLYGLTSNVESVLFLGKMALASVVVLLASRYVAAFLVDAGILFEGFFRHAGGAALPAFAFLTFYSLIVIVFACVYRILDMMSRNGLFRVFGEAKKITFPESLYYSVATLSTVGYGDIVPAHNLARLISVIEVVCGVLLLLFGVSELVTYARRRERDEHRHEKK